MRVAGSQERLYLLLLEFQLTVDRHMAAAVLSWTAQTFLKPFRSNELSSEASDRASSASCDVSALLSRQAARKFGAGTAARLEGLLAGIGDPERFVRLGEE